MAQEQPDIPQQLTPADVEAPEPDAELALTEEGTDADDLVVADDPPVPVGRGWAFDWQAQSFVPSLAGGPAETHGVETLKQWIEKALRTSRGAHPIYGPTYGIEGPYDLIGGPFDAAAVADYKRRVEDALTVHPHIQELKDFAYDHDPDDEVLYVSFTVVTGDGDEIALDTDFPVAA